MVVQEMAAQQPTRGKHVLAVRGKRQLHNKRQRTRRAWQEVVVQQEADAITNQRTRGAQQEADVTRGRGAGGLVLVPSLIPSFTYNT
jgi:hypothetical protein